MSDAESKEKQDAWHAPIPVNLKSPWVAAIYAWLWPGAGHFYQGRYAKGWLFMICVLSTYFFGFALGEGRVVYADMRPPYRRYAYFAQVGVGVPALPALVQTRRIRDGKEPLFGIDRMTPPVDNGDGGQTLARWHQELSGFFEVASLYTMIAGLLNMLAIYDAYAGPVFPQPEEKKKRGPPDEKKKRSQLQSPVHESVFNECCKVQRTAFQINVVTSGRNRTYGILRGNHVRPTPICTLAWRQ